MPQPIHKIGASYTTSPKILLERPKLATLIGAIACEWAYVEQCLLDIFDRAQSPSAGVAHARDPVALAIFDTIIAYAARIDLIETVLRLCVPSKAADFTGKKAELRKAYASRNLVVHTSWNICADYPDDLILLEIDGKAIRYTEGDFWDTLERITVIRIWIHDFLIAVGHAPKVKPTSPKP